jgi:uncharacterized membrane protein YfcA
MHSIWLLFVGFVVGGVGTLVGAGGGFILVPYLILAERLQTHAAVSISLAVVFFNALSGSLAYFRQKKIDLKSGKQFILASVPGAIIGTYLTVFIQGEVFRIIFSFLLLLVVYRMLGFPMWKTRKTPGTAKDHTVRTIQVKDGKCYTYAFSQVKGNILSFFVGIYSGIFGVGGGILHVPIMVGILSFPIHIATATSHFVLVFSALASTIESIVLGRLDYSYVVFLALGVIGGAQVGALISPHVNDKVLKYTLAVLLVITVIKMLTI